MFFVIFRLAFWSLIFVVSILLIRKSHAVHKKQWSIIAFFMTIILITISALLPIENAFMTFSSPQSSYQYNHLGYVKLIISGKQTDFVVGSNDNTDFYTIIPKSDEGWKLGMGVNTKRISQTISDGVAIDVYQYKDSDDYYISILNTNPGALKITDNCGSEFQNLSEVNSALHETFYTYYAYISRFDSQYVLTVDGKTIKFDNE